jgi:Fe-S oxidoreductase
LIDQLGLTLCRDVPEYARLLGRVIEGDPDCILITEFYGESEAELRAKIDRLRDHMQRQGAGATSILAAIDRAHVDDVWTVRKVAFGLMMGVKGDHKPLSFIEDAAVPVEHLAEYVTKVEEFCRSIGTDVSYYAHASAGCVHIHPLVNTKSAQEIAKMPDILEFSVELLHGYGGSLSSEHGDGKARSWLNKRFFGPELYRLYQDVKHIFDPDNILNPGTVVNGPSMETDQRFGETYEVIPIQPKLDFSSELGFDRAVEMCSGMGVCRKMTTGTMCPSFMVTREEEHSTRGRANALRAAMSGRLPTSEFTSERMYEVMDLCVSCKACKAECPSAVDMSKIKVEFLAQYYEAHGTPLRARMFGNIARLSRFSSGVMAPLANIGVSNPLARRVMERLLGISSKRALPSFAWEPFTEWFEKRGNSTAGERKQVVLFNDTFNTYNYPEIAIAATEVFEKLGYEVLLPGHGCCGRPMVSEGLIDSARAAAQDVVNRLAPFALANVPIVGLEPSCLLTLRDEYPYLLSDNPYVQVVAEHAFMFEEFIASLADAGEIKVKFTDEPREILLHGHCHQKALVGTKPSHRVLSLPPNYTVKEVDSGCCGMAGSFGYEAEHYDISLKMAERRLLPAVREAAAETLVVAAGVSCRQQINHGASKQALHPAQVLRDAML